ncbi:uncharacterized protein SPPG_02264 [Spizellomyces punctatus DAOM BR117]|uniref:DUF1640 domain-containing protein n=1 Tax=Spizellomyces punctatus (strain DAOM BR117) TaxID=645134 RepID=A0A0L0HQ30_SPIPD|nr:uncharacterized protein SPPG_02264 [Spizellomyces punctatus DAOM BR117]KND03207.1 hypothetical protein SPPG_02264 [Spizellomyces punctatus DAOM BR117]|eukprot:XP_016611246.1 hypothetical protein SPPG_02264 [Spizellomyces punctatus DAOM BR117]
MVSVIPNSRRALKWTNVFKGGQQRIATLRALPTCHPAHCRRKHGLTGPAPTEAPSRQTVLHLRRPLVANGSDVQPEFHAPTRSAMSDYIRSASLMLETSQQQRRGITSKFNFDTYKLVRQLERQGFTRGQAVAIMRTINALLVDSTLSIRSDILSKTDLENQTYLYKAHLQELRNELQLLRQNDSAQLKADTEQILRDIESMNAKFSEFVGSLKTDVSMDLNNHKTDGREVGTDTDLRIQEIHHKLIVRISDLKTKIETMKVETTRIIVWMALGTFAVLMSIDWISPAVFGSAPKGGQSSDQPPPPIISAFPHPLRSSQSVQQPPQHPQPQQPQQSQPGSIDSSGKVLSF